jgi:hypothetical protein
MHVNPYNIVDYGSPTYPGIGAVGSLGDTSTAQINALVTTGAQTTTALLVAFGAIGGPIGAAVGGLIALASTIVNMFHGCGSTCVVASNDANKVEQLLQQNLTAYLSSPTRTQSMQAAALNNFNTVWQALVTACSDPSLGTAGKNCISDRQQGSCAYKTTPGGWQQSGGVWAYTYPGANGSGSSCWNWFIGYHDPIANDPAVVADSSVTAAASSSAAGGTTGATSTGAGSGAPSAALFGLSPLELALIGGVVLLLVAGGD